MIAKIERTPRATVQSRKTVQNRHTNFEQLKSKTMYVKKKIEYAEKQHTV